MKSHLLDLFRIRHLTDPNARRVAALYAKLAKELRDTLSDGPEATVALRKLVESKDCAVRAVLPAPALDLDEEIAFYERDHKPTIELPPVPDEPARRPPTGGGLAPE